MNEAQVRARFNDEVMYNFCLRQMKTHAEAGLPTTAAFEKAAELTMKWRAFGFEFVAATIVCSGCDYILTAIR